MNINTRNLQTHNGVGFWLNKDGSRSAEYLGRVFTFTKTRTGWTGDGKAFATLAQAADHIINNH